MKHLANKIAKKQGGYSLVELSIALAIVAVILVGGLMGTRQIIMTNNVNNQLKDSAQVITKITRNFQKQPDTSTVLVNNLAPIGVWPAERATKDSSGNWTVRGIMGGSTETVFPNTDTTIGSLSTVNQGFLYTIHNIPSAACADLVNGLDSIAYAIYAGDASKFTPSGAEPTLTKVKAADTNQVDQATLATGCSTANARVSVVAVIRM
jgi:prepilin-type N-terminal cleavage/methylation domain-containing protein